LDNLDIIQLRQSGVLLLDSNLINAPFLPFRFLKNNHFSRNRHRIQSYDIKDKLTKQVLVPWVQATLVNIAGNLRDGKQESSGEYAASGEFAEDDDAE